MNGCFRTDDALLIDRRENGLTNHTPDRALKVEAKLQRNSSITLAFIRPALAELHVPS